MSVLEKKKRKAEIMRMQSNILDAEVQIEERKEEIIRVENKIKTFEKRITVLEEELNTEE